MFKAVTYMQLEGKVILEAFLCGERVGNTVDCSRLWLTWNVSSRKKLRLD